MHSGQQILTIAAIVLLSLVTLTVFRIAISNQQTMFESDLVSRAIHSGQILIEDAKTKYFDVANIEFPINSVDELTSPFALGPRYDESYPYFNDVDDYKNLDLSVNDNEQTFLVQADVYYVDKNNSNYPNKVYYKTYQKCINVTVSNSGLPQPIVLKHVFTYY